MLKPAEHVRGKPMRDEQPATKTRAWQRMLSGRRLDLLDPRAADIEIGDIAHGLARVARWNGQTHGAHAFSVAQHSLLVETIFAEIVPADWLQPQWRLAALLHDAPEYVIGDLISPFKAAIGIDYKAFEFRILDAIHARFAVPAPLPEPVKDATKQADRIAAYFEATVLAGFSEDEARTFFGSPDGLPGTLAAKLRKLQAIATDAAEMAFIRRFDQLQ